MRVVVSCVPQTGHVLPLLPLAEALAAQGDDVVVASGPDVAAMVVDRGLAFRTVGPSLADWFGALAARTRGIPGDGLAPSRVQRYFVPRLFGEIGTALVVDDLMALGREFEPALVIFDPYLAAGPLVAAATGAEPVLHAIGPLLDPDVLDLLADAVSPIWRQFDLEVPAAAGVYAGTTLTVCPTSFDPRPDGLTRSMALRPTPLPVRPPPELPVTFGDPERPLVYLTLGTFSNNAVDLFSLVLDVLADQPVNVVATIGRDHDPAELGAVPENARVEQFIPQSVVLPHCSAVVHHAGAGTTFGVLAHSLPSLVLPQSADNFEIAGRLAGVGASEVLMPGQTTPDAVRSGLGAVLADPGYAGQARLLARQIAAMPSPSEVAARLAGRTPSPR